MHYFVNKITGYHQLKRKAIAVNPRFAMYLKDVFGMRKTEIRKVICTENKFIYIPIQKVASTSLVWCFLPLALGVAIPRTLIHYIPIPYISRYSLTKYRSKKA